MKTLIDKADRFQRAPRPNLGPMRIAKKLLEKRGIDCIYLDSVTADPSIMNDMFPNLVESFGETTPPEAVAELREAIARRFSLYYNRPLHPEKEIALIPAGKMTMTLLFLALVNPGDIVAVPDPGLAVYRLAGVTAGAEIKTYPLLEKNDYLPNPAFFESNSRRLKLVIVNYPHNPTGVEADLYFYHELLDVLKRNNALIVADCPYCGISEPPTVLPLQIPRSMKRIIELHSFGFPYGIPDFGFAIGHKDAIANLAQIVHLFGLRPTSLQLKSAHLALQNHAEIESAYLSRIDGRRKAMIDCLRELGLGVRQTRHGPFVWAKIPPRATSTGFARKIFVRTGVRVRPGSDFGEHGEGYIRISLTVSDDLFGKAVKALTNSSGMRLGKRV